MRTCLIVDESPVKRRQITTYVAQAGWQFEQASSPFDALAVIAEKAPDCMVLDWEMPGMNGIEMLKRIRALPQCRQMYIILYTSNNAPENLAQMFAYGANAYLEKPISPVALHKHLQAASSTPKSA